jgi:hypothetical protein
MQESQVEIKYLKVDKNTDWLSCQRKPLNLYTVRSA